MLYTGFDIGGTKCAVCLGEKDEKGMRIVDKAAFLTPGTWREAMDEMLSAAKKLLRGKTPDACGFSCGGPLDWKRGVVMCPPNLPAWDNVPVTDMAREALGAPAFLENDANACALAEWRFGAGRGEESMAFFTFGTGLGAGLILDGRLIRGATGNAGEAGHIRLRSFGPAGYGKEGSFEGFCSGGGLAQLADTLGRRAAQRGKKPAWLNGPLDARHVAQAARQGDETALEVFRLCGAMLGEGLAVVADICDPGLIVIGSIFTRCRDLLEGSMWESLRREALPGISGTLRVESAMLGEEIGDWAALGVAEYGLERGNQNGAGRVR